ncbi:hypothetical protein GJW-30_1_01235 [Variibacter gotjawalensis]|jgi:hypothetical protein|uniref:Uncharacterized protein n=1 Tax=Variibacter gotjawalensis TaxID=1333996 RepID=A0A0S3PS25_9BRAD|nr:hypothetical protein [Variibacter gotjawalensis]NIK49018.1 hypothetical protein [Variibacter gotjawalensis]RZS50874.1 hypothetical protein EV661_3345 [Variibacter gotjawalensis]BAT58708.1 hypothetical protein GJW-30_1_01235 [Variibacter gotjawalensis]
MSLTFACPRTGALVRSGIRTDRQTFARTRNIRLYVRCECCGDEHLYCIKDGKLEDAA